jgi:hypothetical protein
MLYIYIIIEIVLRMLLRMPACAACAHAKAGNAPCAAFGY